MSPCFLHALTATTTFRATAERPSAPEDGSLTALRGDLLELESLLPLDTHGGTFVLAVCMGDTLTHLQVRQVR